MARVGTLDDTDSQDEQLSRRPFGYSLGLVGDVAARKQRADVIYVYSPNYVVCGTAVGMFSRTPVVLWLAFRGPPKKRPWGYQKSFRRVAKIMAISQATAKLWSSSDIPMPEITPVLGGDRHDLLRPGFSR